MRNALYPAGVLVGVVALVGMTCRAQATGARGSEPTGTSNLTGTVRAVNGTPLGGVSVSARALDTTITTSIFTDERGDYVFPFLGSDTYRVWAQAVGFETVKADVALQATRPVSHAFTLPAARDMTPQLSGIEWLDALPEATKEDRRLKQILRVQCSDCHSLSVALQNRFDERGWLTILQLMEASAHNGWSGRAGGGYMAETTSRYRQELAQYLTRMRGPGPSPMTFKPLPRPSGDAARVVITAYEVPVGEAPELAWHNGSDWSEGPGTGMRGAVGVHDVVVDGSGQAWLTESRSTPDTDRTVAKVDPRTGQVTAFKLLASDGKLARASHGLTRDPKGMMWFDTNGALARLDPATETFTLFTPPRRAMGSPTISVDSDAHGRIWTGTRMGALRLDPATNTWKLYQNVTPADGFTYGVAADADGNGWWASFNADRVGKGDVRTGKSHEVFMRDPRSEARRELATPADNAYYELVGALSWGGIIPHYANAPRRPSADKTGNTVWVPNYYGQNLARIDIRTLKTRYYPLPINGHPYTTVVDKYHNVWTDVPLGDRVLKLDPKTERWTVYQLPSLGCSSRHMSVDDLRDEVWVPCDQTSRIMRIQFRTAQQIAALKRTGT